MRTTLTTLVLVSALLVASNAEALTIGVAAPLSGQTALLGQQIVSGAEIAGKADRITVTAVDDACTADGGTAAAKALAAAKVDVVIGFLCTESIEAALPILKDAGIPTLTVGVRTESLTDQREKTRWLVWRLGPRGDDERNAAASILTRLWRDDLFAIVDDGTIYGRELAETVRNSIEQAALKPVFVDNYRPEMDNQIALIGRLKRAGAAEVFVGGDGSDIAIMARDAAKLGAGIVFAGGETLRSASEDVPLATGTLMIAPPEWAETADKTVLDAFAAENIAPDGYTLPAYAAVELARQAAAKAASVGKPLADELTGQDFRTVIGTVRFDQKGDLTKNPYRLFRYDGTRFVPAGDQ